MSITAWDTQTDSRAHHGGERGWRKVGGAVDGRDPRSILIDMEEGDHASGIWGDLIDGFQAGIWDAFADGVHPAEVMRRFYLAAHWARPDLTRAIPQLTFVRLTGTWEGARQFRLAEIAGTSRRPDRMEEQLETWRRKGPGRCVRADAPAPGPCWDEEGPGFREGVGQWVARATMLGDGPRWAVRGVFALALRLKPQACGLTLAEMSAVFGVRKTAVEEWAGMVLDGSGVRGRDQKRSLSCAKMAAAQQGNSHRANAAKRERILNS